MQDHILALQELPETGTEISGPNEPALDLSSLSFTLTYTILTYDA